MKKTILIFSIVLCVINNAMSQGDGTKKMDGSRLEALKVAYLTKQLNLTPEDAQKFWPVYNKYNEEMRQMKVPGQKMDELDREEKIMNIRKKYKNDFTKALTDPERVNRFYKADREFGMMLQKEMMERRQMRIERKDRPGGMQ